MGLSIKNMDALKRMLERAKLAKDEPRATLKWHTMALWVSLRDSAKEGGLDLQTGKNIKYSIVYVNPEDYLNTLDRIWALIVKVDSIMETTELQAITIDA